MKERILIGRDANSDIRVSEDYDTVSNDHAEIILSNGVLTYTDHSSNGTIINGNKIKGQSLTVKKGDIISLAGKYTIGWDEILQFFPSLSRSTILIGEDNADEGKHSRATMSINEMFNDGGVQSKESRSTEYRGPISDSTNISTNSPNNITISSNKQKLNIDRTFMWGGFVAIIILIIFATYLFNDIIYNIL